MKYDDLEEWLFLPFCFMHSGHFRCHFEVFEKGKILIICQRYVTLNMTYCFLFMSEQKFIVLFSFLLSHRALGSRQCWRVLLERTSYLVDLVNYCIHMLGCIYIFSFFLLNIGKIMNANSMQGLLLEGHLSCSYIRVRKGAENMQSFSIFQGKDSLILVYLFILIEVFKFLDWF